MSHKIRVGMTVLRRGGSLFFTGKVLAIFASEIEPEMVAVIETKDGVRYCCYARDLEPLSFDDPKPEYVTMKRSKY